MSVNGEFNQIKRDLIDAVNNNTNVTESMRKDMDILLKTVNIHDEALYGNRTDKPGVMEDVRFLKANEANRQKHTWAVWLAIIPVILERIWSHLLGKH